MAVAKLFKSNIPNIFMILSSGIKIEFPNGRFHTTNEEIIAELTKEVKFGHPQIYIDEAEQEVDTDALTPYEQMRKKIREELQAEMAAASALTNDRGNYSNESTGGVDTGLVTTIKAAGVVLTPAPNSQVQQPPAPAPAPAEDTSAGEQGAVPAVAGLAARLAAAKAAQQ